MLHQLLFIVPYFFIIGTFVGMLSMLFGIGGGLIIVPAVNAFLQYQGYSHNIAMKSAIATSLITIMASTLNVLYRQNKLGDVPWSLISKFLPFVITGSLIGLVISSVISGIILNYLFIAFLFYVIIHALLKKDFKTAHQLKDFKMPSALNRRLVGFIVGNLSILIGVGGNILFVPYLRHYKLPMKNATSCT